MSRSRTRKFTLVHFSARIGELSSSENVDTTGYDWRATYQVAGRSFAFGETGDESDDPSVKYKARDDPTHPNDGSLARPDVHCGSMF